MNVLEDKDVFVLHTASYLFAMGRIETNGNKTPQEYIDYFVTMYLEKLEHSPSCGGTCLPCYSCLPCYVQKYLDVAKSILDLNKFDEYKEGHV